MIFQYLEFSVWQISIHMLIHNTTGSGYIISLWTSDNSFISSDRFQITGQYTCMSVNVEIFSEMNCILAVNMKKKKWSWNKKEKKDGFLSIAHNHQRLHMHISQKQQRLQNLLLQLVKALSYSSKIRTHMQLCVICIISVCMKKFITECKTLLCKDYRIQKWWHDILLCKDNRIQKWEHDELLCKGIRIKKLKKSILIW